MQLFDTLTKSKVLLPESGPIRMYFCGPTVYQRAHIGNARPFVLGMWLRNWLRVRGRDVKLVHNITDINDRIYEAAPGASAELAARATDWYLDDTGALGLGRADELPKASEYVPQIVRFISELFERGYAYEVEGDVWSNIPLRNRRENQVTRITEGMTRWRCEGLEGAGLSEYLDQIVNGVPVGTSVGI